MDGQGAATASGSQNLEIYQIEMILRLSLKMIRYISSFLRLSLNINKGGSLVNGPWSLNRWPS